MNNINRKIVSTKVTKEVLVLVSNEDIAIGTSDVTDLNTFHISERHTDVTAYTLSEKLVIILSQATKTLKKTTQKFLCSVVIMLARR